MYYDLNVPWTDNQREMQRAIAFLDELGYDVVALTHTLSGKIPSDHTSPIPATLPFTVPSRLRILRRCTLLLTDSTTNNKLPDLRSSYDIVAARPTSERTLQQACQTLDVDIISLDLTQKFETHFKFPTLGSAIARGVKIELCYGQGVGTQDANRKRLVIGNATQLIRVSRGRGLVFSSDARSVLALRAPADVINLASVWGLGRERGKDGLSKEPRSVVEFARLKKESYRGVVDVVYGGEKPAVVERQQKGQKGQSQQQQNKRKGDNLEKGSKKSKVQSAK
ncbi:PHP domain-like protein [Aaosphaeria arxii CBS 175.79]|uniref:PHP domain-like protein n=1 Tax=Aaosphaeria arxii CBS 175.79 TaxID=1450172 RepID=A0A6A5XK54_9PLEO|nr:PHP domain-like protein [Aaosphaeria arxii CBS 175.79]KAF2013512.1 PHP domain-like protein [Aaosphaeria arxii CBS 175.79]